MIPFLDLAADYAEVEGEARRRLDGVLARQQFVLGPEGEELERSLSARMDGASAVAVSSGSEALALALAALGVGQGDAVLVPAFSFFATAGSVLRVGALPVFCDVDASTGNASASTMRRAVERDFVREAGVWRHRASGARLAVILPVHLYGRVADMPGIVELARELGARVVEDAAQAIGTRLGGRTAGCLGDVGCLSFYPTKNLGGAGDGGMVVTHDADLARRVALLRTHGSRYGSYEHELAGVNARMGEMVAAVLVAKLPRLDAWMAARRAVASFYHAALVPGAAHGLHAPAMPVEPEAHGWHQVAVRIDGGRREDVRSCLEQAGIATRVFYPLPLHRQPCFASLPGLPRQPGALAGAEAAASSLLCLPIFPSLGLERAAIVAEALLEAVAAGGRDGSEGQGGDAPSPGAAS